MRTTVVSILALIFLSGAAAPSRAADTGPGGYEMTTYYVGFLYRGPQWSAAQTPEREAVQNGHMAHIQDMAESGKLVVAGPFSDDGALRGMFIFRVGSLEEARALCDSDPAVKAGRLKFELHPWYAASGIKVEKQPGKAEAR